MKKHKFERIADKMYEIAIYATVISITLGAILFNLGIESIGMIFGYIAAGGFIYIVSIGFLITVISWEIDDYMEKKETKKHGA